MRLIDADEFIKYANKNLDICAGDLICMIDEQPTAYEIEKVVKWLETEIEWTKTHGTDGMFRQGRRSGLMTAIRIVKDNIV